jgi:hypothetical protein
MTRPNNDWRDSCENKNRFSRDLEEGKSAYVSCKRVDTCSVFKNGKCNLAAKIIDAINCSIEIEAAMKEEKEKAQRLADAAREFCGETDMCLHGGRSCVATAILNIQSALKEYEEGK